MRAFLSALWLFFVGIMLMPTPGHSQEASPTFYCQLRTPAGDTLGLTILVSTWNGNPNLFIYSRDGKSWPGDEKTALLGVFERNNADEFEFSIGKMRVRIVRGGQLKNITFWSTDQGKVMQPLAFGYCGNNEIKSNIALAPINIDLSDRTRWIGGCFAAHYGPNGVSNFDFKLDHAVVEGENLVAKFYGGPFVDPVAVRYEMLRLKSEHPSIRMGAGRFGAPNVTTGPRGMEVGYYDERDMLMSTIVKFNTVSGSDGPAYGICGMQAKSAERLK